MIKMLTYFAIASIFIIIYVLRSFIKQINQNERGVILTMGKYTGIRDPGLNFIIPFVQSLTKIDIRVKTVPLTEQEAITRDNISIRVSAVIFYQISEPSKALLKVENYYLATSQLAETTMRNVVGEVTLDELLANREKLAERIQSILSKTTNEWGINVSTVELKDVVIPKSMQRTMAKVAEAEREKQANIIKAKGEVIAADNLAKAASIISSSPGAMHLRTLNTLNDLSSDQSNTIIFAIPLEILRSFNGDTSHSKKLVQSLIEKLNK